MTPTPGTPLRIVSLTSILWSISERYVTDAFNAISGIWYAKPANQPTAESSLILASYPGTTLGPTEGYWNVGLGVQYSPTPATFIAGGVKYFWLGDAKAQTGAQSGGSDYVAEFEDNNALAYGLKIGYKF